MNKKALRIMAAAGGFCIIAFLLLLANVWVGNPISATIVTAKIRSYVANTYPEQNFHVPRATYNFKDGSYGSFLQSGTSPDTAFRVSVRKGDIEDSYPYEVANRFTTYRRLSEALDAAIAPIVEKNFLHRCRLITVSFDTQGQDMASKLNLDMTFDLKQPPFPVELTVWTEAPSPNYEEAAARLLELKRLMEERDIPISYYSLSLEHPYRQERDTLVPERFDAVMVTHIPADAITADDGLPHLLEEHQEQYNVKVEKEKSNF